MHARFSSAPDIGRLFHKANSPHSTPGGPPSPLAPFVRSLSITADSLPVLKEGLHQLWPRCMPRGYLLPPSRFHMASRGDRVPLHRRDALSTAPLLDLQKEKLSSMVLGCASFEAGPYRRARRGLRWPARSRTCRPPWYDRR